MSITQYALNKHRKGPLTVRPNLLNCSTWSNIVLAKNKQLPLTSFTSNI